MTFTQDMSHFCVGMADGSISVTKSKEKEKKVEVLDDMTFLMNMESKEQAKDYKYFFRGIYEKKPKYVIDDVIETKRSNKLSKYDQMLKYDFRLI